MKDIHDIIIKPLITEKSSRFLPENKYFFEVSPNANKVEIRKAIEKIFNVKVETINTVSVRGHKRRQGRITGFNKDWKKAIVKLKEGKIDLGEVKNNGN
ncbi:MAG: 50S ribosomal protein L23 [Candidatus Margulisiibacteriota bacterium]|jgi:large subunit ribosomal protein L23